MDLTARQAEISDLLRQEEFITVETLAERFDITTQTVRRDINALCEFVHHEHVQNDQTFRDLKLKDFLVSY